MNVSGRRDGLDQCEWEVRQFMLSVHKLMSLQR